MVAFREETCNTPLQNSVAELFNAKSMMLIPILDQNAKMIAFMGLADRRGASRTEEDLTFAYAVLSILANYIKLRLYQKRIESTQQALTSIVDSMGVDIYVNDFYTHEVLFANRSMAEPYGGVEDMVGRTCWSCLYAGQDKECEYCPKKRLTDDAGDPIESEIYAWDYQRPLDNKWFHVLSTVIQWVDGRPGLLISSIDITENKKYEDMIQKLAAYDSLTGLPNRYKLSIDCDELIPKMEAENESGYLLFFDLDGFKAVNDNYGHQAGDELLVQIGEMLQSNDLTRNKAYRYGGDEFVIPTGQSDARELRDLLGFLKSCFEKPFVLSDAVVSCNASIGISCYPEDDKRTTGLLRKADQAMYLSKSKGRGQIYFYNNGNICKEEQYFLNR